MDWQRFFLLLRIYIHDIVGGLITAMFISSTVFMIDYLFLGGNIDQFRDYLVTKYPNLIDGVELPGLVRPHLPAKCVITDPAAKSMLDRMETMECRKRAMDFVCSRDRHQEPVVQNTCTAFFNASNQYVPTGCYRDNGADRILNGRFYSMPFTNSIEHCVQTCLHTGFTHAGVEFRIECHCGYLKELETEHRKLRVEQCQQMHCPGDPEQFCGGFATVSVYKTGIYGGDHSARWPIFTPLPPDHDPGYQSLRKPPIRILFLLQLNGRNVRQVKRMLKMIYSPEHRYFVNVDPTQHYMFRKMRKIQAKIMGEGRMNFEVAKRADSPMIWGGSSYLDMFLDSINHTISSYFLSDWDYLINLSETDMPLLPLAELEYNLYLKKGMSFMSSTGPRSDGFIDRQGLRHFFMECEGRMWKVMQRENFPENLRIDGGLDWLVLHRDFAEFALLPDPDKLPAQLRTFFSSALLPMEGFWQSLALNSHFCERTLYKNLRSVNWPNKQQRTSNCRCNVWHKFVDWCGCWPLIFRADEPRLEGTRLRKEFAFFGRKFDALVDADAITRIERIVSPEKSELASSSPAFNATWINLYDYASEKNRTAQHKVTLLNRFARTLIGPYLLPRKQNCTFGPLLENVLYKANSAAEPNGIFAIQMNCPGDKLARVYEALITPVDSLDHPSNFDQPPRVQYRGHHFELVAGPEFGLNLDHKYELFRSFPPLIDLDYLSDNKTVPTILWRWRKEQIETSAEETNPKDLNANSPVTSPPLEVRFYDENDHLVHRQTVPAFDSVEGNQYFEFGMNILTKQVTPRSIWWESEEAVDAGPYTVQFFSLADPQPSPDPPRLLFSLQFPVFPLPKLDNADNNKLFDELAHRFFELKGICHRDEYGDRWPLCAETEWSSIYPDPKAKF